MFRKCITYGENVTILYVNGVKLRKIDNGRRRHFICSIIYLYANPQNSLNCNWPATELHELMHVFGFNHSMDSNSLMYPYLTSCNQKLDNSIIEELIRLYSIPNLPDLYFENISAIKISNIFLK